MNREIETFINAFVKEIDEENAAIFAGAGLSVAAGFVNWRDLLEPLATELGLNIEIENDLISVAQYHLNEKNNRSGLHRALIEQFSRSHKATENHKVLARLPIKTYWTTNYDPLIEETLKAAGKIPDVKYTVDQLKHTKPNRDAIVYKMHGDVEHPDSAVLTKDDYEKYQSTRGPFVTALSGDLVSKTFLFLGFSFTDPNLDYILSRVRISLHERPRQHYCIFRKCCRTQFKTDDDFNYATLKQGLATNDLKRFGVQTLLVDDYKEVTAILQKIESRFRAKTVFISGSAHEYGKLGVDGARVFLENLSQALIKHSHRIVSGFGLGVGGHVITGALQQIYEKQGQRLHNQLLLRPFPQGAEAQKQWEAYRQDMISYAGTAIFVFGNKFNEGKIISASGMRREFEIAKEKGLNLVPIGATDYLAHELWTEMNADLNLFYPGCSAECKQLFNRLGDTSQKFDQIIENVVKLLDLLKRN